MKKSVKIGIVATGDEITQGSVLNTNGQAIAHTLLSEGFQPNKQIAVADEVEEIQSALQFLFHDHDVVITIGGLGPTSDDKTRFALANFLNTFLVEHAPSLKKLSTCYEALNLPFLPAFRQQALFPDQAEILDNGIGSANGCMCRLKTNKQKIVFMLPGPPRECLPMFQAHVLPRLKSFFSPNHLLLQWKVFGIAEGLIAERMDEALQPYRQVCRTAFRWDYPYVDCKVLLKKTAPEQNAIIQVLQPVLGAYQLNPDNQKATEALKQYLVQQETPLFIQDDATGGVLESLIHTPQTHGKVIFRGKDKRPFFHIEGLHHYWQQEAFQEEVITLTTEKGAKQLSFPYRSALLELYAAELVAHHILCHLKAIT